MELCQANQLNDQTRGEKSWLREELETRSKAFHEGPARDYHDTEELPRICCVEADEARQLKNDELAMRKESFYKESAVGSNSGTSRQGKLLE